MLALPRVIMIAIGHNNIVGLQSFPAEPHFQGLEYPRIIETASGISYRDGTPFARLRFAALDAPEFIQAMTQAGVYTAKTAAVTIQLPDDSRISGVTYNGIAVAPEAANDRNWEILRFYDVVLVVKRLALLP